MNIWYENFLLLYIYIIMTKYKKILIYTFSTIINLLIPVIYYLYVFIKYYEYINIQISSLVLTNLSIIPTLYITFHNLNVLYPEYLLSYPIMFSSGIYHLCDSSRRLYG